MINQSLLSVDKTMPIVLSSDDPVMIIDNVLAMHGRKPFSGERRVLVAMA